MLSTKGTKTNKTAAGSSAINSVDARLADAARLLQTRDVPPALRQKVIAAFEAQSPWPQSPQRPRVARRLAACVGAVVVVGTLFAVSLTRVATPPVSAAEITSAIQAANTWHLQGWRLSGGKKVPWEVWGRRQPFFYREQIGNEIVLDDGEKRLHLLPPQRMHPTGLLLVQASRPLRTDKSARQTAYDTTAFLDGTSGEYVSDFTLKERKRGDTGPLILESRVTSSGYIEEQTRVTADPQALLPMRYEVIRRVYKGSGDHPPGLAPDKVVVKAALQAAYNVPVPVDLLRGAEALVTPPPGYRVVDFTAMPRTPTGPQYGQARKGGITLVCETLARDEEGNLRLKYQVWLGDVITATYQNLLDTSISTRTPPFNQPYEAQYPTDNAGNTYLRLSPPDGDTGAAMNEYKLGYFVTAIPLAGNVGNTVRPPATLTLPLRVQVQVMEDDPENGMRLRTIAEENMTVAVPLPAQVGTLAYDRPRTKMAHLIWRPDHRQETLRLAAAWRRGSYWNHLGSGVSTLTPHPVNKNFLKRAKAEYTIALAEAERTQNKEVMGNMQRSLKSITELLSRE
ncbi:MAG: hypothetical protein V4671_23155 [Armatimonadota bacterium]